MSPLVWDLAHIGHFEELWISRRLGGAKPIFPEVDDTYDAFAHEREERPSLELLDPTAARTYLAEVRARSLTVLDEIELDSTTRCCAAASPSASWCSTSSSTSRRCSRRSSCPASSTKAGSREW